MSHLPQSSNVISSSTAYSKRKVPVVIPISTNYAEKRSNIPMTFLPSAPPTVNNNNSSVYPSPMRSSNNSISYNTGGGGGETAASRAFEAEKAKGLRAVITSQVQKRFLPPPPHPNSSTITRENDPLSYGGPSMELRPPVKRKVVPIHFHRQQQQQQQQYSISGNTSHTGMYITTTDSSGSNSAADEPSHKFNHSNTEKLPPARIEVPLNNFKTFDDGDENHRATSPSSFPYRSNKYSSSSSSPEKPVRDLPNSDAGAELLPLAAANRPNSYQNLSSPTNKTNTATVVPSMMNGATPINDNNNKARRPPTISLRHMQKKYNNTTITSETNNAAYSHALPPPNSSKPEIDADVDGFMLMNFANGNGSSSVRNFADKDVDAAIDHHEQQQHEQSFRRTYSTGSGSVGSSMRNPVRSHARPHALPLSATATNGFRLPPAEQTENATDFHASRRPPVPFYARAASSGTNSSDSNHYAVPSSLLNSRPPVSDNAVSIIQEMFRLIGRPLARSTVSFVANTLENGNADIDALVDSIKRYSQIDGMMVDER